ncbi:MAG TPA: DUF4012 domain-containing protein [Candidatus Paceibacterota bacterium]|nr:DUF4012 domain-containing protein [Candidatus Paceibacterota bacterium]
MPRSPETSSGAFDGVRTTDGISVVRERNSGPARVPDDALVHELLAAIRDDVPASGAEPVTAPGKTGQPVGTGGTRPKRPGWLSVTPWFIGAACVVAGLLIVSNQGIKVRDRVVQGGRAAIAHLFRARESVESFRFDEASDGFALAYAQFSTARDDLAVFDSWLGTVLSRLPGGGSIASARNLIEAGTLLSRAGGRLSDLVAALSESGSILDPANDGRASFAMVLLPMQEALTGAAEDLARARQLLAGVDPSHVPEEYREELASFGARIPEMEALVHRGAGYVRFLEDVIAGSGEKTYLILFQNASELRPTGGFPGSYGVAVFRDGRLMSFEADDVYNPDGQIDELIVPPLALQRITPDWGLRDSTWFADFPLSAAKAVRMYELGSGRRVDGVLAVTPEIVRGLLEISGPVSMPQYDLVLDADNFLPELQAEVEYGINKQVNKPKKIVMELTPIVLRKLYQAPRAEWLKVLSVFSRGLQERDIMMYSADPKIQEFIAGEGFDGSVHRGPEDFLMVVMANVAGAKADYVTDTTLGLETTLSGDGVAHSLVITRSHEGGDSPYGFYNQPNRSYIRVLVPEGSMLTGISGNTVRGFRALTSYAGAVRDPDLDAMEGTAVTDAGSDVTTYRESGRTAFGFWLDVRPGGREQVTLSWTVPSRYAASDYALYVQKQPGLNVSEFSWDVRGPADMRQDSPPYRPWKTDAVLRAVR